MTIDEVVLIDEIEVFAEFNGILKTPGASLADALEAAEYLREVQNRRAWQEWIRG